MAGARKGRSSLQLGTSGLAAILLACGGATSDSPPPEVSEAKTTAADPLFVEAAAASGLHFVHRNGGDGRLDLATITCGGGALIDSDNDGDLDIYLPQGGVQSAPTEDTAMPHDRFFRSHLADEGARGTLFFTDASDLVEADTRAYGCAVATGDVDNDGRTDLYLANLGPNLLLGNRGQGRFVDTTAGAGVGDDGAGVAATFFDYDRDGWLDLFVGNYVTFGPPGGTACRSPTGAPDYCGPSAYPAQANRLWRNRGDGSFVDTTAAAGLARSPPRPTMGVVSGDFDGDGWLDLYIANDGAPNELWINLHDGTFADRAALAGCALDGAGAAEASMGVDSGDFDRDGDLDLVLGHLTRETNTLYRNRSGAVFDDHTASSGLGPPSLAYTAFGSGWLDFDNDGWLDLLTVNGAVTQIPSLVRLGDPFPLHQPNQLFRSLGKRDGRVRFLEVGAEAAPALASSEVSRGAAFGDIDNDGDTDVVVINNGGPARLLINQVGQRAEWLGLRLTWGTPPRDALGSTATVHLSDGERRVATVGTDGSYASANDPRLLVGLGSGESRVQTVEVLWPDGAGERFAAPPSRRYTVLHRGEGEPLPPSAP